MKKTFCYTLLILVILFSGLAIAQSKENILIGFWNFGFPVSDDSWGYLFLDDGRFIYYDNSKDQGYLGTSGKWKEEKNRVYLLPEKDLIYNHGQFQVLKSKYHDWQLVADLRSINYYWYPSVKDVSGYPPAISIKLFKGGEITHYVQNYFRLYGLEGIKKHDGELIKRFEETGFYKK